MREMKPGEWLLARARAVCERCTASLACCNISPRERRATPVRLIAAAEPACSLQEQSYLCPIRTIRKSGC
jgi:hypothetical protein